MVAESSTSSNFCCCFCETLPSPSSSTSQVPSPHQHISDDQIDESRNFNEEQFFVENSPLITRTTPPVTRIPSGIRPGRLKISSKLPQNIIRRSNLAQVPLFHYTLNLNTLLFLSLLAMTIATIDFLPRAMAQEPKLSIFSADERQLLRGMFLKRFGLESLGDAISQTEQRQFWHNNRAKRSATQSQSETVELPEYIWDTYEEHSEGERQFETIRHYFPVAVISTKNGVRLTFNLSTTGRDPVNELVIKSNLRLPIALHSADETSSSRSRPAIDRINVFSTRNNSVDDLFLLSTKANRDEFDDEKSIKLDVKEAFLGQSAGTNPELVHFIVEHPSFQTNRITDSFSRSAALVIYVNSKDFVPSPGADANVRRHRRKRSVSASNGSGKSAGKRRHRKHRKHHHFGGGNSHHNRDNGQRTHCRRSDLYVDFGELNWQDWIMAPVGYEAYQCRGKCTHPMPSHLNTTNHAIIQSLMHSIDPSSVPAPSCVPVQMSAISILYKDLNNVVVVKTYTDMKVDACGCH